MKNKKEKVERHVRLGGLGKNDIVTADITDINHLGMGIAVYEGIVICVKNAVPGDRAEIKIIKCASSYLVGIISRLITPSPYRKENDCPTFPRCGGCIYRHVTGEYEAEVKRHRVENEFRRFGLGGIKVHDTVTPKWENYRNKLEYPVSPDGVTGFYAAHSHDVIKIDSCSLQEKMTDGVYRYLSAMIAKNPIPGLRHLYLRCGVGTGEVAVVFVSSETTFPGDRALAEDIMRRFPEVVSVVLDHNPEETNVILGKEYRVLAGKETIRDILCGLTFEISPLSFYQVNHDCAELLYRKAAELARIGSDDTLADLYCGIGTVGLCMASIAPPKRIFGVEVIPEAIGNAKKNAVSNGYANASYVCGKAEDVGIGDADVVVLDPPRKGCAPSLIEYLGKVRPKRIVYISCSPDTLARDCAALVKYGYVPSDAYPFNMFPRTEHIETVIALEAGTGIGE